MGIDPICGHKSDFLRDNRFITVIATGSLSGHFGENAKGKPKIRHHFYHPFEPTVKSERRSNRTIQIASASFHENTMTKVPIAVIPRAGRSQQRSQTKPEISRNETTRDSRIKRTIILFSPFHLMYLLYHWSRALSSPFLQKFRKFFDNVYCGRVNGSAQVPTIPNLFIIVNQDGHVIAVAHAVGLSRAILDAVEVVIVEALFFKPSALCFTNGVLVFLARILREPSDDIDFPTLGAEKFANLIQFSHIAHRNGSPIGRGIFRTEKHKPILDAVEVSNSAVHVKVDGASSGYNVGLDVSDFHWCLPLSFTVSVLYHTFEQLSREILAIFCFIYPFFPLVFGKLFMLFLPKTACDNVFYCVINREILVEKNKVLAKEPSSTKEFAVRADNFIYIDE